MNTPTENTVDCDVVMDVRPIPCSIKHKMIIQRWRDLPVGEHFVLLNDHDPVPLYYQFMGMWPGVFAWEHLEKGPVDFRVKITKVREIPPEPPKDSFPITLTVESGCR